MKFFRSSAKYKICVDNRQVGNLFSDNIPVVHRTNNIQRQQCGVPCSPISVACVRHGGVRVNTNGYMDAVIMDWLQWDVGTI